MRFGGVRTKKVGHRTEFIRENLASIPAAVHGGNPKNKKKSNLLTDLSSKTQSKC